LRQMQKAKKQHLAIGVNKVDDGFR